MTQINTLISNADGRPLAVSWRVVAERRIPDGGQMLTLTITLGAATEGRFDLLNIKAHLADAQRDGQWLAWEELADVLGLDYPAQPDSVTYAITRVADLPETLCAHGRHTRTHPDYPVVCHLSPRAKRVGDAGNCRASGEGRCPDCDREDYADIVCDLRGGT